MPQLSGRLPSDDGERPDRERCRVAVPGEHAVGVTADAVEDVTPLVVGVGACLGGCQGRTSSVRSRTSVNTSRTESCLTRDLGSVYLFVHDIALRVTHDQRGS